MLVACLGQHSSDGEDLLNFGPKVQQEGPWGSSKNGTRTGL